MHGAGVMRTALLWVAAAGTVFLSAGAAAGMTRDEAMQLYAAGGFPISANGDHPTNRCGVAANPHITFVDMNGDGRKEALFIDQGSCYRPDGRWYAITTTGPDGRWRRVLDGEGTLAATGKAFGGWFVLTSTSAGKATRLHYNGSTYVPASAMAAPPPGTTPQPAVHMPSLAQRPLNFSYVAAEEKANLASVAALSPIEKTAILKAAGMKPIGKGKWTGCIEDDSHQSEAGIALVADLNGDGRKEAVVQDGGTFCNGMAGVHSYLLTRQANGAWALMFDNQGFFGFLKSRGTDNYPDIEGGLPGMCFPYFRWNGAEYALIAHLNESHRSCQP